MRGKKPADFIVVKYMSSFMGVRKAEWCRVAAHYGASLAGHRHYRTAYRELDCKAAQKLIKAAGLVCVQSDKNGEIYDTPDRAFLNKYENNIVIYGA